MSDQTPILGGVLGEVFVASAAKAGQDGIALTLPGQTQPTEKRYRSLAGAEISKDDQVLCVRLSGTIVVLGKIGLASDAGEGARFIPAGSSGLTTADGRQFISRRTDNG